MVADSIIIFVGLASFNPLMIAECIGCYVIGAELVKYGIYV